MVWVCFMSHLLSCIGFSLVDGLARELENRTASAASGSVAGLLLEGFGDRQKSLEGSQHQGTAFTRRALSTASMRGW